MKIINKLNLDITDIIDYYDDNDVLINDKKILLGLDENGMPVIQVGNDIHTFKRNKNNINFTKNILEKLKENNLM